MAIARYDLVATHALASIVKLQIIHPKICSIFGKHCSQCRLSSTAEGLWSKVLCRLFAGLIELVSLQLTAGPCQSFRRPTAPTDTVVKDVPAMAAFSKAALDGGIEHDSVYSLYQVALLSCISVICLRITLLFRAFHLHNFLPGLGRDVHPLSVIFRPNYPLPCIRPFHHYLGVVGT